MRRHGEEAWRILEMCNSIAHLDRLAHHRRVPCPRRILLGTSPADRQLSEGELLQDSRTRHQNANAPSQLPTSRESEQTLRAKRRREVAELPIDKRPHAGPQNESGVEILTKSRRALNELLALVPPPSPEPIAILGVKGVFAAIACRTNTSTHGKLSASR